MIVLSDFHSPSDEAIEPCEPRDPSECNTPIEEIDLATFGLVCGSAPDMNAICSHVRTDCDPDPYDAGKAELLKL